jgi:hypothetical protein
MALAATMVVRQTLPSWSTAVAVDAVRVVILTRFDRHDPIAVVAGPFLKQRLRQAIHK